MGAALGTVHPHTCAGVAGGMCIAHSSAVARAGEFSTSGLGEGLSREAPRGQAKQQQRGTEELDVSRRTVALPSRSHPSPGATFCASRVVRWLQTSQLWSRQLSDGPQKSEPRAVFRTVVPSRLAPGGVLPFSSAWLGSRSVLPTSKVTPASWMKSSR